MDMIRHHNHKLSKVSELHTSCNSCGLGKLCLPMGLNKNEMNQLDDIIKRRRPVHRGDYLFRSDDPLHSVYAVRSGSLKTFSLEHDGQVQINGFSLPGELIGLDAIGKDFHGNNAVALETSSVCEIPFKKLESLSANIPSLQHQLFCVLSNEISHEQELIALLGKKNAEQRLAAFILSLSMRFECRSLSPNGFNLSMSRSDIANYLGLAVETVSRIFTRFSEQGILCANRKLVTIKDKSKLYEIADINEASVNHIRKVRNQA